MTTNAFAHDLASDDLFFAADAEDDLRAALAAPEMTEGEQLEELAAGLASRAYLGPRDRRLGAQLLWLMDHEQALGAVYARLNAWRPVADACELTVVEGTLARAGHFLLARAEKLRAGDHIARRLRELLGLAESSRRAA